MLKKFFITAIFGLTLVLASAQVEAEDVYVGKSDATGFVCYIMTETIECHWERNSMVSTATLKMTDDYGQDYYLDYTFHDFHAQGIDVRFKNSQNYSGEADPRLTPIEWAMFEVIRDRY